MDKNALIIFARNPVLGKVKNRLAKTIGKEKALQIYTGLLNNVYSVTKDLSCQKYLFLTENKDPELFDESYIQKIQSGKELGAKMLNALYFTFSAGNEKVLIIGTDVPGLTSDIIIQAFEKLSEYDVVIGPAKDGGYYLIGMKKSMNTLFENMKWSNDKVLSTTIERVKSENMTYCLLEELIDIDTEDDLPKHNP